MMQTLLTALASRITTQAAFFAWIIVASITLGIGMSVTFSLTVDLVPRINRGLIASLLLGNNKFDAD